MTTSVINSDDGLVSGTSGLKTTGGNDGNLNIQANGTTRLAVSTTGVAVTGTLSASGAITGNLTGNASGSAGSLATANWTVTESGGKLYFAYGGANKASLDSSGNLICVGNVTAYGTP